MKYSINEIAKIEWVSQSKVWHYQRCALRLILSSNDKDNTELVDNTLRFAGMRKWYKLLHPLIKEQKQSPDLMVN